MNIIEAVKNNDIGEVRRCIARNEDVNAKDNYGNTVLMLASGNEHPDIAELLLRSGADVNAKNNDGWSALMYASWNGHTDTAELLLRFGADVNTKDNTGWSVLMKASYNRHLNTVELLLRSGADVNAKNDDGWTALIWASRNGYSDIAELLLRSGADVNVKSKNGNTALIYASRNGYSDIVELLLRSGSDVNVKSKNGNTALIYASRNGHSDIAERIVSVAMSDPCVPYTTVDLSSFVPRWEHMNAQDYANLVAKVIPLYPERAVEDATFGRDMQQDVEEILGGKTGKYRESLTDKDKTLLSKLLKTLRSIDYTDRIGQESDKEASPDYDMEL